MGKLPKREAAADEPALCAGADTWCSKT